MIATVLLEVRTSAEAGMAVLDDVRNTATATTLLSGSEVTRLRAAERHFDDARAGVRSLVVSPLRALPVLGRQLRSVDALTAAAGQVSGVGAVALEEANAEIGDGAVASSDRAHLLARLADVAGRVGERLQGISLGPEEGLVGPLAQARATAAENIEELQDGISRAREATAGLAQLLGGDSRYLLLLGNNAEMRAGSGTFLTVGPATLGDGRLAVGELEISGDLLLAESVPIEGDLADRWGWLEPGREWRNLGVSPRFDVTGALAIRMWEAAKGERLEGAIAVDVVALEALLRVVGPIHVEGKQLDAGNVAQDLLHDQYAGDDPADLVQSERSARLAMVAAATLQALQRPDIDIAQLAQELAEAAAGRHLMLWSADPEMQRAWAAAGVDGALDGDELLMAVLNRGGNKLDPFLEVEADLAVEAGPRGTAMVIAVRLSNRVTEDEAPYILGPDPSLDVAPGTYVGLLSATLPGTARDGRFDGVDNLVVAGSDGPTRVVAAPVTIPPGEQRDFTLRFQLPPGPGAMDVVAGARVPPTQWQAGDQVWAGDHMERVEW
jgi:hypothetical protein